MAEASRDALTKGGVAVFDKSGALTWCTVGIHELLRWSEAPPEATTVKAFRQRVRSQGREYAQTPIPTEISESSPLPPGGPEVSDISIGSGITLRESVERRVDGSSVITYLDVSDLLSQTARARQESSLYRLMLDFVPAIISVRDADGQFRFANQATLDATGLTEDEIVGRGMREVFPEHVAAAFLERDRQAIASSGTVLDWTQVFHVETVGDQHIRTRSLAPQFPWDGEPWAINLSEDVTDTVLAGQALEAAVRDADQANAAKSAFVATMSHEIRTPLNGILGMAQAMAQEDLPDVQRGRLEVIQQSGEALLAILNDILDLSKIEAGMLTLEAVDFDIEELARGAYSTFTALANKKRLSFALTIEPEARGFYRGDSVRIRQILYNLVSNGLKFTEHGEVRVTLSAADNALRLTVADTGTGIPAERLPHLFERFVQADASTTRRYGGTGLGLSICKELATMMEGSVEAASEVDRGSRFTVTLPLPRAQSARAPDRHGISNTDAVGTAETSIVGLRVLAAEDNVVNQLVLKTLLHQFGIQPVIVNNGREAVEAWESGSWDLVLMDVQMPDMDGVAATQEIRRREAENSRTPTPIVALTANVMAHQVSEYRMAGFDDVIAKPIEVRCLYETLCGFVSHRTTGEDEARAPGPEPSSATGTR